MGVGAIYAGIKVMQVVGAAMRAKAIRDEQKLLGIKAGQAAAASIINPTSALVGLAVAAGVGGLIYSQMKDGIIGSDGGMVVSGPKGSIQLDKNDSVIAGTDLGGSNNTTNPKAERMVEEQLQESKQQNQLLSQLIGNTNKLKNLDSVSFYEIQ